MNKLSKLEQLLKETNTKQEFNIVEDLKSLALSYGVVKSREFRKKLNALIAKYENDELTAIRQALIKKCQNSPFFVDISIVIFIAYCLEP